MHTTRSLRWSGVLAALVMAFSMVAVDHADARRGGSFGSRGTRTYQSAPATTTAPSSVAPVQRSMTPNTPGAAQNGAAVSQQGQRSGGFFGGSMFGGLLGGLAFGGLLGMLMGNGFGGLGGMFGFLIQALLIGGGIMLLLRFLRSRNAQAPAMAGPAGLQREAYGNARPAGGGLGGSGLGRTPARPANPDELGITPGDLNIFERRLAEVQAAYGREDYAGLRRITTPEMMGYFSEELGQNASRGLKNEVSDVTLLQGDVAESWREGNREYATVAMRYSSIDVTRERASGRVVEGDASQASETTEVWTFVRENRGEWLLSAIQET